jgi:carbamoyltransferase
LADSRWKSERKRTNVSEWILGLGGSDHDFSAALMLDRDIRVAIEQERLTRRKHGLTFWYESPLRQAIEYCLAAEGISMADVGRIVSSDLLPTRVRHDFRELGLREFPHHLCHAASAYMMLPPGSKAGVLVYDGYGSIRGPADGDPLRNLRETFSFFIFGPDGYECVGRTVGLGYVEQDDFPTGVTNSIGMLYELVTAVLGYDIMDSGKTMGLSSHGAPRYLEALERFVAYGDDASDCFRCATDDRALEATLERILLSGRNSFGVKADLAASLQALMNKTLLHCERFFRGHDIKYLCLAGGCALNMVANSFLVEHSELGVPVVIPPHCDDAGLAFGALWLEQFAKRGAPPELTFRGRSVSPALSRPGRAYTREECRAAVQEFYPRLALDAAVASARELAHVIATGAVVGVLNGGAEVGPRALGGRSILADPRSAMTREKINRLIKGREPFRPLAPIVLRSQYDEYFLDGRMADPFMLKVARARERCLREAPAVVHVDGTARVQVVTEDGDSFLIELLGAFGEETGTAILLNTSFNRRGEPIVESPLDAVDAFLGMGLDGLYLDGEFYRPAGMTNPSV